MREDRYNAKGFGTRMILRLDEANVVVTATHFNPSVFNQIWLTRTGLATEAEVTGRDCVFTDSFVQILTKDYHLVVTPVVFQLSLRGNLEDRQGFMIDKLTKVATLLPHTPFSSVGLNFHYLVKPEQRTIHEMTKSLFFVAQNPLYTKFESPNTKFGGYISVNWLGSRLKLDIAPVMRETEEGKGEDWLLLDFNFHHNIENESSTEIKVIEAIAKWESAFNEAKRISELIQEGDL